MLAFSPPTPPARRMVTQRSGEAMGGLALTAFRVLVHPVIFSQLSAAFRSVLRHLGECASRAMRGCWRAARMPGGGLALLLPIDRPAAAARRAALAHAPPRLVSRRLRAGDDGLRVSVLPRHLCRDVRPLHPAAGERCCLLPPHGRCAPALRCALMLRRLPPAGRPAGQRARSARREPAPPSSLAPLDQSPLQLDNVGSVVMSLLLASFDSRPASLPCRSWTMWAAWSS